MALPNFLIIGAQKAGTTRLAHHIEKHPEVYIPKQEIHYFDKGFNYNRGLGWDKRHFDEATIEKAIGEKTPEYLWANGNGWEDHLSNVHENLAKTLPKARLIITLRNPVNRAISAINHIIRSGRISPLHDVNELLVGKKQHLVKGYGILEKGMYYSQLEEYKKLYPDQQMLVLIFEEMISHPQQSLKTVFDFLGIDKDTDLLRYNDRVNESHFSRTQLAINYHLPILKRLTNRYSYLFKAGKIKTKKSTIRELQKYMKSQIKDYLNSLGAKFLLGKQNSLTSSLSGQ